MPGLSASWCEGARRGACRRAPGSAACLPACPAGWLAPTLLPRREGLDPNVFDLAASPTPKHPSGSNKALQQTASREGGVRAPGSEDVERAAEEEASPAQALTQRLGDGSSGTPFWLLPRCCTSSRCGPDGQRCFSSASWASAGAARSRGTENWRNNAGKGQGWGERWRARARARALQGRARPSSGPSPASAAWPVGRPKPAASPWRRRRCQTHGRRRRSGAACARF